jgi:hypothetical protein
MDEQDRGRSSSKNATVFRVLILLATVTTVAIVGDIFRSLDALPVEITGTLLSEPTIALSLVLLASAAVAFGASVTAAWRNLTSGQRAAFLFATVVLLITAWGFHQALWHLAFGHGHVPASWFG